MTTEAQSRTRRRAESLLGFYADTGTDGGSRRPNVDQQSEIAELLDCIVELAAEKAKKDLREE